MYVLKWLQRLRCKCNFHALKFVPKIQQVGSILIKRIRKYRASQSLLDTHLVGKFIRNKEGHEAAKGSTKYLALHLRFEVDMVAYSLCEFGGGENERNELQAYRERHFPLFLQRLKNSSYARFSYPLFIKVFDRQKSLLTFDIFGRIDCL